MLGLEPRNLRVAAGLGLLELVGTQAAAHTAASTARTAASPAWEPSDDPREILDKALVWAAKSDRVGAIERLVQIGADASIWDDLHGGTPAGWAARGCHPELAARLSSAAA